LASLGAKSSEKPAEPSPSCPTGSSPQARCRLRTPVRRARVFYALLNNLPPQNRTFRYLRIIALIGIAPIPNRRCGCTGIRRVIVAVVIATINRGWSLVLLRVLQGQHPDQSRGQLPNRHRDHRDASRHPRRASYRRSGYHHPHASQCQRYANPHHRRASQRRFCRWRDRTLAG